IMPPPRRFAGQPPRALRAQVVRPAKLPACGKNGIYRKNDTQLDFLDVAGLHDPSLYGTSL
ncbi:MAG: hypothetical protein AB7U30_07430, partial [Sulfuricellaceae bacterium]